MTGLPSGRTAQFQVGRLDRGDVADVVVAQLCHYGQRELAAGADDAPGLRRLLVAALGRRVVPVRGRGTGDVLGLLLRRLLGFLPRRLGLVGLAGLPGRRTVAGQRRRRHGSRRGAAATRRLAMTSRMERRAVERVQRDRAAGRGRGSAVVASAGQVRHRQPLL